MRRGVLVVLAAVALPFLPVGTSAALADEGSPVAPASVSPRVRPPEGVLRHVEAERLAISAPSLAPRGKELIVLVGGYQSCACPDDGTFDAIRTRIAADGGFDVVRFGTDPKFPYDTYGPITPSAINLRDQIRSLAPKYDAVHVITHSMGGVVADQAFADGLSRDDGVVSYVSLAAPHSGSDAARALVLAGRLSGTMSGPLRESLLWLDMEQDSAAVRDLATTRAIAPPPGVVRLDIREATDVLVTDRDARDSGVVTRTLATKWEGHGDILKDATAIDLTMRTITDRRVPPDDRPRPFVGAVDVFSGGLGKVVFGIVCVLAAVACVTALVSREPAWRFVDALDRFVPRASRRSCPP